MQLVRTTAPEEATANGSDRRGNNKAEDYGQLQESQLGVEQ
jgi:hypothetical protein